LPNQLFELLKSLLAIDPTNRPSAKEILAVFNGGQRIP
jgi:serine/threonine protein kinase